MTQLGYVYPDPEKETWEQHMKNLPANEKPSDWEKFTRKSIDAFTQALMSPDWLIFSPDIKIGPITGRITR